MLSAKSAQESYKDALYRHAWRPADWEMASQEYEQAYRGGYGQARRFKSWIEQGKRIEPPFSEDEIERSSVCAEYFFLAKTAQMRLSEEKERGLELISELSSFWASPDDHFIHGARMAYDAVALRSSYLEIVSSIKRVGPIYNALDRWGMPLPGTVVESDGIETEGWLTIERIVISGGRPYVSGLPSSPIAPLITPTDVDVALWLAFGEGSVPVEPAFSLDRTGDGNRRLDRKTFSPAWLAESAFGQSMYLADWIMKGIAAGDGLPSLEHPELSAGTDLSWKMPAFIQAMIKNADAAEDLGNKTARLMITLRSISVTYATMQCGLLNRDYSYAVEQIIPGIDGSYVQAETPSANPSSTYLHLNDSCFRPGAIAYFLTENYNYLASLFPVFHRISQLLSAFAIFAQARRDGATISKSELRRIQRCIREYQTKMVRRNGRGELSPKPFHAGGCYCSGGVRGPADVVIKIRQSGGPARPIEQGIDFVVSPTGFVSPVPYGATRHANTKSDYGILLLGGSGGTGVMGDDGKMIPFNKKTSGVFIAPTVGKHRSRTYYLNITGQKIDPFTGRTVDPSHFMAHLYHDD